MPAAIDTAGALVDAGDAEECQRLREACGYHICARHRHSFTGRAAVPRAGHPRPGWGVLCYRRALQLRTRKESLQSELTAMIDILASFVV